MIQHTYKKGDFIGQKYEVVDILGEGGYGIVYLAFRQDFAGEQVLHPFYALKTFRNEFISDATVTDLFCKEAQVWIDLESHPYIVKAYFVDLISDRLFIATEFICPQVEGGPNSLETYLKRGPLDLAQSLRWAIQFCHGMEYAYSKGIRAHRDIKPSNIMIDHEMAVKISDFGLAGVFQQAASNLVCEQNGNDATQPHTLAASAGTPEYMPPEQFTDFAACDERSDIYSFGVVLYQMASEGKRPFSADNSAYRWMALRHLHQDKPVPKLNSPYFPMIQKCLEKEPKHRYQFFKALRVDLETILKRETGEVVKVPNREVWSSQEWNNRGISFMNLSKHVQAIECFDKALDVEPRNGGAWSNKGNVLRLLGRHMEAIDCYDNAIKINPSNARAWFNKAALLSTMSQIEYSLQCLHRVLDIRPIDTYIVSQITGLLSIGDFEPAGTQAICQKIVSLNLKPNDIDGLFNLGCCYRQIYDTDNALEVFLKAEKLAATDSGIWFQLMEIYFKKQDPVKTAEYCDKLIAADAQIEEAVNKKSRVLSYTGRSGQAISLLQNTLKNNPRMGFLWCTLSEIQEQNNKCNDALESARQCLALLMQNESSNRAKIEAVIRRIDLLRRKSSDGGATSEIQQALQQLKKAEAEHFEEKLHTDAIRQLTKIYTKNGDKQKALYYCDMLLKTTNYITDFGHKAMVMSHFGDHAEAVQLLADILKEWPTVDSLWYVLSKINEDHGNITEALRAAMKCREVLTKSSKPDKQHIVEIEARILNLRNL